MRELFVYYRLQADDATALHEAVRGMQSLLCQQHPQLIARLLHRPDGDAAWPTWMETYATDARRAPAGIDASLQAAIEAAGGTLPPLIDGARHVEVFIASDRWPA